MPSAQRLNELEARLKATTDQTQTDAINAEIGGIDTVLSPTRRWPIPKPRSPRRQPTSPRRPPLPTRAGTSADDLLAAAANKPVDADVKAYVDTKLQADGILDYYRSLATAATETGTK